MSSQVRNETIDFLRGVSIFVMILIHVNAYFQHIPLARSFWNASQFAVATFIFCSAYIFFSKNFTFTISPFLSYAKKRLVRLFVPYYIALIPFFLLIFFTEPNKITPHYIFSNLTVTGGIDVNWLILLFVYFLFLFPLVSYLNQKSQILFIAFVTLSTATATLYLFYRPAGAYKEIMWLPWSLIIIFALYFKTYEHKKWFYPATLVVAAILFFFSHAILLGENRSLDHFSNKYPPNLYHLAYGIMIITALHFLFTKGLFQSGPVHKFISFLSLHSYSIYFIHYLLLLYTVAIFKKIPLDWYLFFPILLVATLAIQEGIDKLTASQR